MSFQTNNNNHNINNNIMPQATIKAIDHSWVLPESFARFDELDALYTNGIVDLIPSDSNHTRTMSFTSGDPDPLDSNGEHQSTVTNTLNRN